MLYLLQKIFYIKELSMLKKWRRDIEILYSGIIILTFTQTIS